MPVLVLCGDEDDPCIEASIFMKRAIPRAGLAFFPKTGHTLNLEEPDLFNSAVQRFLLAVQDNRWNKREKGSGVGFLASPQMLKLSGSRFTGGRMP
jgi:proline iminopeptidase